MTKQLIYGISDSNPEGLRLLAELASLKSGKAISIDTFVNVDNQFDLERILFKMVQFGKNPLILFAFQKEHLASYLKNFCDLHQIPYLDLVTPIVFALNKQTGERSAKDPVHLDGELFRRIEALDFATRYDDGKDPRGILKADIVLIGISRTCKTPLAVYLANRNYKVANVPLFPESDVPEELFQILPSKIFGLTASISDLRTMRRSRLKSLGLPQSAEYAQESRILEEAAFAGDTMREIGCAIIDVSSRAVEEVAEIIIRQYEGR